jgi:uncharacterized phiE125 gp8 family phage protein
MTGAMTGQVAEFPQPAVGVGEVKAYLRLAGDDEDAVIAGLIRTAMLLCEAFIGQWLIARDGSETVAARRDWQRLAATPVLAVTAVETVDGPLPASAWEASIDAAGDGWVRLAALAPGGPATVRVRFRAGVGADWNGVPEPLRQGIIRLATHFFTHRDDADAGPPPAAVAALWRPWRRMRLG